jgi:hypothetical protein
MVNHIQGAEDPTSAAGPTSMLVMEQPDDITTHQTSEPQHVLHGSQQSLFSEYPNELEIGTDSSDAVCQMIRIELIRPPYSNQIKSKSS